MSELLDFEKANRKKGTFLSPAEDSSPNEVLAEDTPKNCSRRRDSGTGLTMNLRPAEWTT